MWTKICANTNVDDTLMAADAGADAVGFVFAPSPRRVTPAQVADITPELPPDLRTIGVFNTQNFDEIVFSLQSAGLNGVQLHGELDFSLPEKLRDEFAPGFFVIQTLHWDVNSDPVRAEGRLRDELRAVARHRGIDAVLLDTRTPAASGGTGRVFNWEHARQALFDEVGDLQIIVAGGLNPGNVAEAIRTLHPWGVDVASGVESYPGRKDPARLHAFLTASSNAFAELKTPPAPANPNPDHNTTM